MRVQKALKKALNLVEHSYALKSVQKVFKFFVIEWWPEKS